MARYVIVEFDRNEDAENFIEATDRATRKHDRAVRIAGVFVRPGRTCDCPDWQRINYGDKNQRETIQRGERFGWWICTRCNRPRKGGHQLVNQLNPSDTFEGFVHSGFEMMVDGLYISGIASKNIHRSKKLQRREPKKPKSKEVK